MSKPRLRTAFVFVLGLLTSWVWSSQAMAVELYLSEAQLNSMLSMNFPMSYDSAGYHITLSEPRVVFFNEEKRVGLNALMNVREPNNKPAFQGRGVVSGELFFNTQKHQLQLIRPKLNELHVQQVSDSFKPMLEQTTAQLKKQHMQPIVLMDMNTVSPMLPIQTMTSVRVGQNAIIVEF